MYKIRFTQMLSIILFLQLFSTACAQKETDSEQTIFSSAAETGSDMEDAENKSGVQQDVSVEQADRDMLAACAGITIMQTMEDSDGRSISVDARVVVDGIDRVSRYRYIPQTYTEDFRKALFQKMHPAESWDVNEAAAYDAEKALWEFVTPRGESWVYQVSDSGLPDEQIFAHERVDVGLDDTEGGPIYPVLIQSEEENVLFMKVTGGFAVHEIEQMGQEIMGVAAETACSYMHVCGKDSGNLYVKAVYRQVIDGMPVTSWHNLTTASADGFLPVKVWGAFFTAEEIGLDRPILSAEEAAAAMQEQMDSVQIQEESQISVTKISLEYLAVISLEGEPEIVPVWRFWLGDDERERSLMSEKILAVNAVSGELIWEKRGVFTE